MDSGVQLPDTMRFQAARPLGTVVSPAPFLSQPQVPIPARPVSEPEPKRKPLRAVVAGLSLTLVQLVVAVLLIAPEGSLAYRYETLVQHDSHWFASIVDRGYDTVLPPIPRKMLEVSNVAFFPAYPTIAGALHWAGLSINHALLLTAQFAAWGFWSYFFLFCDRWRVSPLLQFFGAAAIASHPTSFFLIAAYSESLFLMALFGFMYWSSARGRTAKVLAVVHGMAMSATRIVGIPCAAYPVVRAVCKGGWSQLRDVRKWGRNYGGALALTGVAMLGAIAFFAYCLIRWGRWDLYMLTQQAGWNVQPDYLAIFKPTSYRWLLPALNDPTQWSQMTMSVGALLFLVVALVEVVPALRRPTAWQTRIAIYFVAFVTYYISVSGVASVQMESMLRYQFCAHALIVLALMHFLGQLRTPPIAVRALGMAVAALVCAAGLSLQAWWVWNFTRGGWVA